MKAILVSIGDELLIGQTVNTNASWLGSELSVRGISISRVITISDEESEIKESINQSFQSADLIILTGGLGPTKDDITKKVLAEYFESKFVINQDALERIRSFFKQRGKEMLEVNELQASLPHNCSVIPNFHGTASGMWFEKNGKVLVSLPGVPYEMKGLMEDFVFDRIASFFNVGKTYYKTLLTSGIGESFLAELIKEWEDKVRSEGFGLAYLPSPGMVKLRLTAFKEEQFNLVNTYLSEIEEKFPEFCFGYDKDTLSKVVGDQLLELGATVGTVESCTGGGVANALISSVGASSYFQGGLITYSYDLKERIANVESEILNEFGAVSEQTVIAMANGGKKKLAVDYCISISGIAGPDGGTIEKPVGTVWMALATPSGIATKKINLGGNRERNIQMTIFAALNMLRCELFNKLKLKE